MAATLIDDILIGIPYSVRVLLPGGRIEEVDSSSNSAEATAMALHHHEKTGRRVWVLNLQTRKIEYEIEPRDASSIRIRRGGSR